MDTNELLFDVCKRIKNVTKKPEKFLSVQDDVADSIKAVSKKLYDFLKTQESSLSSSQTLSELTIDGFDEEQIWQEINLQNEAINDALVKNIAHVLAKKSRLTFALDREEVDEKKQEDNEEIDEESNEGSEDSDLRSEDDELSGNETGSEEDENGQEDYDDDDDDDDDDDEPKLKFTSEVDDDFFKLSEMENYCDKVEKEEESGKITSKIPYDFFSKDPDEEDEEEEVPLIRYNDFFKASSQTKKAIRRQREGADGKAKRVQFAEEAFESDEENVPSEEDMPEDLEDSAKDDGPKSAFQARQERLKSKIEKLEEDALKEKPWHLQGEVSSAGRPQNSLLEEYVEFDIAARPAPVFTEKTTMRLEDVIKQRIKDKSWDDVIRKIKPVEDIREYRKQLVLDQEKSKLSLAEIYEQEFIKKRDAASADPAESSTKEEKEPEEHVEIKKLMKSLFTKLDALSNFHYTPKAVEPVVRIITNMPAINMEEVAPIGSSDGALLAPEEIKDKKKGELMSKRERTTTDKKRERRKKKTLQRVRQKEKEKKEKLLKKLPLGLGNKYSKEKARKALDNLAKERNVDKMVETQSKHLKSSSAFFSKLQDEVKSHVKRKASDMPEKKKIEKFSAKKIKL